MKAAIVPVTPFAQNSTVLWCEKTMRGAVSDPGGDLDRILGVAEENGVTLEKILITHAHLDHAGATADLAEKLNLPIEGPHRADQFLIDSLPKSAAQYRFPPARSFVPTRWLEDGDTVTVGEVVLDVVHCPGHTPGHVVFVSPTARIAIVGDVLFQGSIGRTDLPRGNFQQLIDAITKKLWPYGDDITFVPGHGATSTFGNERKWNPFVSDFAISMNSGQGV
ncbi:MAG: MBL fold metallo-hydrolase [Alphaproteobacteria bacterium]|nr:MBL fold metallo-hydrolase [Alphaproteobacteria bacterium]